MDGHDRPRTPGKTTRTEAAIEDRVLTLRGELEQVGDLGFPGAEALHPALKDRKIDPLPSVQTLNRLRERWRVWDGPKRPRRPPPPPAWPRPEVASKRRQLDSFDVVQGLVIRDGPPIEVLHGVSWHGGLAAWFPVEASVTAQIVVESLIGHWRALGLPGSAQFDPDTIFQGPPSRPDVVRRVSRLCLSLGVVPV